MARGIFTATANQNPKLGRGAPGRFTPPTIVGVTSGHATAPVSTTTATTYHGSITDGDIPILAVYSADDINRVWLHDIDEWEMVFGMSSPGSAGNLRVWRKTVPYAASDATPTIYSEFPNDHYFSWAMIVARGVDTTMPWEYRDGSLLDADSARYASTYGDDRTVLSIIGRRSPSANVTPPTDFTEQVDIQNGNTAIAVASKEVEYPGQTAQLTWGGAADGSELRQFALTLVPDGGAQDKILLSEDKPTISTGNGGGAEKVWGALYVADQARVTFETSGGPQDQKWRKVSFLSADTYLGSDWRAEVAMNEWRFGEQGDNEASGDPGTGALFQPGQRRILDYDIFLPSTFPANDGVGYQSVTQFKDTQPVPGTNGGWDLEVRTNQWHLVWHPLTGQENIASTACTLNAWTNHRYDVVWSADDAVGSFDWYVNGTLIFAYEGATMVVDDTGSTDFDVGDVHFQHWRFGCYRNAAFGTNSYVGFANLKVYAAPLVLPEAVAGLVVLQSSDAVSTGTLALSAATTITLAPSPAQSNATLALTAPAKLTLQTAAAVSNATLALTAAAKLTLGTAAALSNATLVLTAVPRFTLTSAAQSSATLALTAATRVALATSPATSNATLALTAPTRVVLQTAAAQSAATLSLAQYVPLATSTALSSASLALSAPALVPLQTATAVSTATLTLTAPAVVVLQTSAAISTASADVTIPAAAAEIPLAASAATSAATLDLHTGFLPVDITDLAMWLDASQLGLSNGDPVTSWTDLSAAGNDGAITGSPDPEINDPGLNGLPVVRFTVNEGRVRTTSTGIAQDFTLAYVGRIALGGTTGRVVNAIYTPNNMLFGFWTSYEDVAYANGFGTPDTRVAVTNAWKLYSADSATGSDDKRFFGDGTLLGTCTSSPSVDWGGTFAISGYDPTGAQETCDCEVAEVVIYERKLSDAERGQVEDYLRDKWMAAAAAVVPLSTADAVSTATLALTAPALVPLQPSAAVSSATLTLTAKPTVALATAAAQSSATLALTAKPTVALGTSAALSSATLALTAATRVTLQASAASSTATLALAVATRVTLQTSVAVSTASLALTTATRVVLQASSAQSVASLALTAPTAVVLQASAALSTASLSLTAKPTVALAPSAAVSTATLTLAALTTITLQTASAISTATCEVGILVIYQYARPESDVATTGWTVPPLWSKLDETTADDGDFVTGVAS